MSSLMTLSETISAGNGRILRLDRRPRRVRVAEGDVARRRGAPAEETRGAQQDEGDGGEEGGTHGPRIPDRGRGQSDRSSKNQGARSEPFRNKL